MRFKKPNISTFSILLVTGLALLMFVLWSLSLLVLVERQNQQSAETLQQNLHAQVLQLQQEQRLWLQSQYYLLNTLAESPTDEQNFQSFLWDYYQRNPSIWAVNLVEFDQQGHPVSKSKKPGCLQPNQMRKEDFDNFLVPRISSCRIDDKALLEIAGPATTNGRAVVLLVSMDYFDFLNKFSILTGRHLQRSPDNLQGIQYQEFSASGTGDARLTVPIGERAAIFGELHLELEQMSVWELFRRQAADRSPGSRCRGSALLLWLCYIPTCCRPLLKLDRGNATCVASSQQESGST